MDHRLEVIFRWGICFIVVFEELWRSSRVSSVLPIVEYVIEPLYVLLPEQAKLTDDTGKRASCVSTSRESVEEYRISWSDFVFTMPIIVCKKRVRFADVFREACASPASDEMIPYADPGAYAGLIIHDLGMMVTILGLDGSRKARYVGRCLQVTGLTPAAFDVAIITVLWVY